MEKLSHGFAHLGVGRRAAAGEEPALQGGQGIDGAEIKRVDTGGEFVGLRVRTPKTGSRLLKIGKSK
jgi:hypothetical protein